MQGVPWWGVVSAAAAPVLMVGGWTAAADAANPEHPGVAYPWTHIIVASIGLVGVATWPAVAWRRGPAVPWGLRPAAAALAVAVLIALVAWFAVDLLRLLRKTVGEADESCHLAERFRRRSLPYRGFRALHPAPSLRGDRRGSAGRVRGGPAGRRRRPRHAAGSG
jgi:hypothetical protein